MRRLSFCFSNYELSFMLNISDAGHQKPEAVPTKTETRKKETGTDFGKLAWQITVLRRTDRLL